MAGKLTKAQLRALEMVERRNWPAGEPRLSWIYTPTRTVLLRRGLIVGRPGTAEQRYRLSEIADLTEAGRKALEAGRG